MTVRTWHEGQTGFALISNPPVNAIGQPVRQGLLDAVGWAEELKLERVILAGEGGTFAAGADAREFDTEPLEPHLPDVLDAIERSLVPWIAAIEGVAFGGGAEIALACRMRIAAPGARIGFPEVTLGVIPGAGGTQRLPRLVGLAKALEMIATGRPLGAEAAREARLVDLVDTDPAGAAFMVNSEDLQCRVPLSDLPPPDNDDTVLGEARRLVSAKFAGQTAPTRAIEVIQTGLTRPFPEAMVNERAAFLALRGSEQARSLRHMFFAERAARAPAWLTADPLPLDHVAVVGGGTMGAGIAYALLNAGTSVTLVETDAEGIERAGENVGRIVAASLARGLIDEAGAQDRRSRLLITDDYENAAGASLGIEAAFESIEVKTAIFATLEKCLGRDAIIATNTSYLDIDAMGASVADPARVLGLHFFAPAHVMRLLEIVRGTETGPRALATGYALARLLRKVPVLAGVCDGFIGNRILARYREAADTLLMDGATPWEIDEAMVGFGYAMGPYAAQDLSGLDIAYANRRRQDANRDPERRYVPIADRMVELGRLGQKTGVGWYRYPGGGGRVEDPVVADIAAEEAHFAGIVRRDFSAEEICERLVLAMINEAAGILGEGIAASAADIDLVTVFGYGFPRWRGGLMHHADRIGVRAILARLDELALEDPLVWKANPLILSSAEKDTPLVDHVNRTGVRSRVYRGPRHD